MDFWTLLAHVRSRKDCLAGWARIFAADFDAVRSMLHPCPGEYCTTYPDPQTGGLLNLSRFGDRWAAYRDPEADDDGPDIELTEADVLLYRFDGDGLRELLRAALGVVGPSSALDASLECLGTCTQGPKRRRVYWCHARNEAESLTGVQHVIARAGTDGCAVLPTLSEAADRILAEAGVSGVYLAGNISLAADGAHGGCGIACRHVPDLSRRALQGHLDGRLDRVERGVERIGNHVRGLEAENALLKQHLVSALVQVARRVEPEFFQWVLMILGKGSVSGVARDLGLSGSTFDERLKRYADKGGLHRTLYSLVAVRRKGLGAKSVEGFNELFLGHQKSGGNDESDILRRVLDGLEALNPSNFQSMVRELIELVQEYLPDA